MNRLYEKPDLIINEQLAKALYESKKELEEQNDKIQRMEQSRNEMFANISHDLRAPIAAIRTSVDYLLSSFSIEGEELQLLELVKKKTSYMEAMIEDIFLLTKLDNPQMKLELQKVDATVFLETYYYTIFEEKKYDNYKLSLNIESNFRHNIYIDSLKMVRVLDNLMSNALKFTNQGSQITLGLDYHDKCVVLYVSDNGNGIEPEYINKIFERTFRISDARTPKQSAGAGLGLAIAKIIIQKHGGRIWCESKVGVGTTFYISIPECIE